MKAEVVRCCLDFFIFNFEHWFFLLVVQKPMLKGLSSPLDQSFYEQREAPEPPDRLRRAPWALDKGRLARRVRGVRGVRGVRDVRAWAEKNGHKKVTVKNKRGKTRDHNTASYIVYIVYVFDIATRYKIWSMMMVHPEKAFLESFQNPFNPFKMLKFQRITSTLLANSTY